MPELVGSGSSLVQRGQAYTLDWAGLAVVHRPFSPDGTKLGLARFTGALT